METPKEYYYTYYSYEEWGRGYFGSRGCKCLPEDDVKYLGSSKDKTFKPTQKIILKSDYNTREEAYADEIILQEYYKVVENPHFANRCYQTTTKFYVPREQAIENGRKSAKKCKEFGIGLHRRSKKKKIEYARTAGKIGGPKSYELGIGIHGRTKEQRSEDGKKGIQKQKELGVGLYGLTTEQRIETAKKVSSQKWMCLETGHISTPGGLSNYQKARGIDTSKRKRIA
jgi:hypothetical protein